MVFKSINEIGPAYQSKLYIPENGISRRSTPSDNSAVGMLTETKRKPDAKVRGTRLSGPISWN